MPDILIRGMEMPKDGHVIVRVYANGDVCEPTPCPGVWEKVAEAIPIPEGHGRLVDADALLRENGLGKDCENCDRNTRDCNYNICLSRMDVCGWIDDAPTIVPEEGGTDDA